MNTELNNFFFFFYLFQVSGGDPMGAVWVGKPAIQTLLWQTSADICCEGTAAQTTQTPAPLAPGWALVWHSGTPTNSPVQVDTQNVVCPDTTLFYTLLSLQASLTVIFQKCQGSPVYEIDSRILIVQKSTAPLLAMADDQYLFYSLWSPMDELGKLTHLIHLNVGS